MQMAGTHDPEAVEAHNLKAGYVILCSIPQAPYFGFAIRLSGHVDNGDFVLFHI